MKCYIYRCRRKADMYAYLSEKDDFSRVPEIVLKGFGDTEFAMELELNANSQLAKENVSQVLNNLREHGFHIQLPDEISVERLMARINQESNVGENK